jgi:nicotinamide phosphoribosyltransferase
MSSLTPADEVRDEYEAYKYLITEACPKGFMSIVSDTYDFWEVVGNVLPKLKNEILSRDGKIVIRPDSGTPELIICGNPNGETEIERKGLIEALYDIFGGTVTTQGYKVLDGHIGAIYGDSITLERARDIVEGLESKGFASTNIVLGIGSYTFQMNTRDTFGFAMKATYAQINGKEVLLQKDPKTDDGTKKSLKGRVSVHRDNDGNIIVMDGLSNAFEMRTWLDGKPSPELLEVVFENGELKREQSLADIRKILQG